MQTKAALEDPYLIFSTFFITDLKLTAIVDEYIWEYNPNKEYVDESRSYYKFYVGLTDHHEEGEWKWASNGRKLNETAFEPDKFGWPYEFDKFGWAYGEPNGKKQEDCAVLVVKDTNLFHPKLYDIQCTDELLIICEMSFFHGLDVNDLPK